MAPAPRSFAAEPLVQSLVRTVQRPVPLPARSALLLPGAEGISLVTHPYLPSAAQVRTYRAAATQAGCALPWTVLAGIGGVVSDHGRRPPGPLLDGRRGVLMTDSDQGRYDGSRTLDGPVGPLGLLPWTFARLAPRAADPHRLRDAALAAGRFLCAQGHLTRADGLRAALTAYDPQPGFAVAVLAVAWRLRAGR